MNGFIFKLIVPIILLLLIYFVCAKTYIRDYRYDKEYRVVRCTILYPIIMLKGCRFKLYDIDEDFMIFSDKYNTSKTCISVSLCPKFAVIFKDKNVYSYTFRLLYDPISFYINMIITTIISIFVIIKNIKRINKIKKG